MIELFSILVGSFTYGFISDVLFSLGSITSNYSVFWTVSTGLTCFYGTDVLLAASDIFIEINLIKPQANITF